MDLQKTASEFAESLMEAIRSATLEELVGAGPQSKAFRDWTAKPAQALKRKPKIPGANVVATVLAAGTTLKMRALKKDIAKTEAQFATERKHMTTAKRLGLKKHPKPAKKVLTAAKGAAKRSHKKKPAAQAKAKKGARS